MAAKCERKRRKKVEKNDSDDECGSLTWLLSFRLDTLVKAAYDEPEPTLPELPKEVPAPAESRLLGPIITPTENEYVYIIPNKDDHADDTTPKKPPYTYPELIERALLEKGELTVSAIYQWISDHFPFYKAHDERWKNSVRHNLSINPHFRKGARAPQGAGHLWSLAASAMDLLPSRREGPTVSTSSTQQICTQIAGLNVPSDDVFQVIVLDEAAIAAASIMPDNELLYGNTLFLNPVSSEQVVRESGLLVVE